MCTKGCHVYHRLPGVQKVVLVVLVVAFIAGASVVGVARTVTGLVVRCLYETTGPGSGPFLTEILQREDRDRFMVPGMVCFAGNGTN